MASDKSRLTSIEFLEILGNESAYNKFLDELSSRSPIWLPALDHFQLDGDDRMNRFKYRPLTEHTAEKFVCFLSTLRESYLYNYEESGLNANNLKYMVTVFPLWVGWVEAQSLKCMMDFLDAFTSIQYPCKEEWAEILKNIRKGEGDENIKHSKTKEEMTPAELELKEQASKLSEKFLKRSRKFAAKHPPFTCVFPHKND